MWWGAENVRLEIVELENAVPPTAGLEDSGLENARTDWLWKTED